MKRHGILNSEIAAVLARLGHTDTICIADCGLPIPAGVLRIDLALRPGLPSFLDVLDAVAADMEIEAVTLAQEIRDCNPSLQAEILSRFPNTELAYLPHENFKAETQACRAVIRTGEVTPYANILLRSGVPF